MTIDLRTCRSDRRRLVAQGAALGSGLAAGGGAPYFRVAGPAIVIEYLTQNHLTDDPAPHQSRACFTMSVSV